MSSFPTSIVSPTDPTSSNKLNSPSHSGQHQSHNAEIVAIETKLGTGASTPSAGKVLHGTGAGASAWAQVDPTVDIAAMTSATLRGLLSDEVGTGFAVFNNAPTIVTPVITTGGSWSGGPTISDGVFSGGVVESIVFQDVSALPQNVTLPASRNFIIMDRLDVGTASSLEVPSTSSLEIMVYAPVTSIAPTGAVMPFAGSSAPIGWLLCYGQAVSRTTYAALFSVLSTTYGVGDGSTTFNLPDMRGRVVAGLDNMGGTSADRLTSPGSTTGGIDGDTLGNTGGAETHVLTVAQLAAHTHTTPRGGADKEQGAGATNAASKDPGVTGSSGSDAAHNNVQPTIILNYIIKT